MLLKTSKSDKAFIQSNSNNNGKGKSRSLNSRIHRKTLKVATKPSSSLSSSVGKGKRVPTGKRISLGKNQKSFYASKNYPPTTSSTLCDNSNDSGLGFDSGHESHHHYVHSLPSCNMPQQVLALTTNNYHRLSSSSSAVTASIRYGVNEIIPSSQIVNIATSASAVLQKSDGLYRGDALTISKKNKGVKVSSNLTLKTETEDTCGDDFFSTHFENKRNENQISSSTIKSPTLSSNTDFCASSSSEKHSVASSSSSSSLSERSSPSTPTDELSNGAILTENNNGESSIIVETTTAGTIEGSLQNNNFSNISRDGLCQLQIITQPEPQHRARYQTEGSRGAVKDKSGNGFPVVKLNGFNKSTTLQVFIGNDMGRVSPHIFYQACKVSGKNSTPCNETKIDGTMIIEIEMKPENDMTVICDCVGILKERNVDVEHRLGKNHSLAASVTRNKKKSTKCRMIFRTKVDDGEILQVCSNTITCTQPPGVPEISKKSLDSCSIMGGKELFIIGKNFLKDTKVTFVRYDHQLSSTKIWEESVIPDKEYLQQTHLICVIPPYDLRNGSNEDDILEPIQIQIYVESSNKKSEPHNFMYLPLKKYRSIPQSPSVDVIGSGGSINGQQQTNIIEAAWNDTQGAENSIIMPPPPPLVRKPSFSNNIPEVCNTNDKTTTTSTSTSTGNEISLKCEYIDQTNNSNSSSNSNNNNNDTNNSNSSEPSQSTSSSTNMQQPSTSNLFNDSAMIDVTNTCYVSSSDVTAVAAMANMVGQVQVQSLLNETLELQHLNHHHHHHHHHHIKNEQNEPQTSTPETLNSAQQQSVVENFINMICAQVEVPQVVTSDLASATSSTLQPDHTANLISAISSSQSPMICDANLMSSMPISTAIINECHQSNDTSNASLVSNAVSESVAETQAVVQNIIANVAAEILHQDSPTETQSTINNFISTTLGASIEQSIDIQQQQQQQISSSQQQQQLQEIIAQELLTPVVMIKKEENGNGQNQNVQENLMNVVPQNVSATNGASSISQPFSPTPDFNLTAMSENDLINFINPTVFM